MLKNTLALALILFSLSAKSEVLSIVNPDGRVVPMSAGATSTLYLGSFVVKGPGVHDVIFHARSLLNTGATSLAPYGNRVQMSTAVINKAGTFFCGDSFTSSVGALILNGAVTLSLPVDLQAVCRLNEGVYVLRASATTLDGDPISARFENAIIDIR